MCLFLCLVEVTHYMMKQRGSGILGPCCAKSQIQFVTVCLPKLKRHGRHTTTVHNYPSTDQRTHLICDLISFRMARYTRTPHLR